jgi:hypothetical protein
VHVESWLAETRPDFGDAPIRRAHGQHEWHAWLAAGQ